MRLAKVRFFENFSLAQEFEPTMLVSATKVRELLESAVLVTTNITAGDFG